MKNLFCLIVFTLSFCVGCNNFTSVELVSNETSSTKSPDVMPVQKTLQPSEDLNNLIAFVSMNGQTQSIAVMTEDGQQVRFLTDGEGNDFSPQWSPNGQEIAFLSDRTKPIEANDYRNIWLVNVTTSELTPLTSSGGVRHYLTPVTWFPDGNMIAYQSFDAFQPRTLNPYAPLQGPGVWLLLSLLGIIVWWGGRMAHPRR